MEHMNLRIARQLNKIAKELIAGNVANQPGEYKNFTGTIDWQGSKAQVKHATFKLTSVFGISWKNGTWNNGTWKFGFWHDGIWNSGTWEDGQWYNGTWKNGTWRYGTWSNGTWKNGTWKDGNWFGGKDSNGNKHQMKDSPDKW